MTPSQEVNLARKQWKMEGNCIGYWMGANHSDGITQTYYHATQNCPIPWEDIRCMMYRGWNETENPEILQHCLIGKDLLENLIPNILTFRLIKQNMN